MAIIKIDNHKLEEHKKLIKTPKTEPSAKIANNQGPLIVVEKSRVIDVWQGSELTPEKLA